MKPEAEYYMRWREEFDEQWGWFTRPQLIKEIKRIKSLDGEMEANIELILLATDVSSDFGV